MSDKVSISATQFGYNAFTTILIPSIFAAPSGNILNILVSSTIASGAIISWTISPASRVSWKCYGYEGKYKQYDFIIAPWIHYFIYWIFFILIYQIDYWKTNFL
jgi:hypothetical protein